MGTEVEAAAALAAKAAAIERANGVVVVALPPGWSLGDRDVEQFGDNPVRSRGRTFVYNADAFAAAVARRAVTDAPSPVIYADEATNSLTAVLNDDYAATPGWRDYRVELFLRSTPEWTAWKLRDGKMLGQEAFAEHIEDSLAELREPAASVMLELAQTFHATTAARFKGGNRLASGARQFVYEEDIEASGGAQPGTIEIPERLLLAVAPFYGSPRYEVGAWFRYRLTRESFALGYKLDRPHEVERAAFDAVRGSVEEKLSELNIIAGPAPDSTERRNSATPPAGQLVVTSSFNGSSVPVG